MDSVDVGVHGARLAFQERALPGAYPHFLAPCDWRRADQSYGGNGTRLLEAKRQFDPDNVFSSAIPLPGGCS